MDTKLSWREFLLIGIAIVTLAIILFIDPIPQADDYHQFIDANSFLGIPNFLNVLSNLPFLIVGVMGYLFCQRNQQELSWKIMFVAVALVTFGSAYYHWIPNSETLVWDRFPMAIGFMGMFVGLLSLWINRKLEKILLMPMVLLGAFSVIYWAVVDDLRLYAWVQFFPFMCLLVMLMIYPAERRHRRWLIYAILMYLIAKLLEYYDSGIYDLSFHIVSGHSLKHVAAAGSPLCMYFMLKEQLGNQ